MTSTLSAASWSTSTRENTSRESSPASAPSRRTPPFPTSTTMARNSSATPKSTPSPRSSRCQRSRRWRAPRFTASTRRPRARLPMHATSTPTRAPTTGLSGLRSPIFGPCAHIHCVRRPKRSSSLSAWSTPSSDTTFLVSFASSNPRPPVVRFFLTLIFLSPRPRREAQAREDRKDASPDREWTKAAQAQQQCLIVDVESGELLKVGCLENRPMPEAWFCTIMVPKEFGGTVKEKGTSQRIAIQTMPVCNRQTDLGKSATTLVFRRKKVRGRFGPSDALWPATSAAQSLYKRSGRQVYNRNGFRLVIHPTSGVVAAILAIFNRTSPVYESGHPSTRSK